MYFIHLRASRCNSRFTGDVKRHKFIWSEGIEFQAEAKLVFPQKGEKSLAAPGATCFSSHQNLRF